MEMREKEEQFGSLSENEKTWPRFVQTMQLELK